MPTVTGTRPDTGEIVTIEFHGNFPLKDPETDVFLSASKDDGSVWEPLFPNRERVRYEMLNDDRQEIIDTRPMAAAVEFSDHIPPERKIAQMMLDANFRAQVRQFLAEEEGVETFDEFPDYDDMDLGTDGLVSAHEIIRDHQSGLPIPRFLEGAINNVKQARTAAKAALATPPAGTPPSPSPAEEEPSADGDS